MYKFLLFKTRIYLSLTLLIFIIYQVLWFKTCPYQYLHGLSCHELLEQVQGGSTNPRVFRIMATTASPQVTFWHGSTPTIRLISLAKLISRHIVATMPGWSKFLRVYSLVILLARGKLAVAYIFRHKRR